MDVSELRISSDAVASATGRTWEAWRDRLDERGGRELDHRGLVALVRDRGGVERGWWQQTVANGYEKLTGERVTGETLATGFQIGAQRTLEAPPPAAWAALTSPEGLAAWLGHGAEQLRLEEGRTYRLADGSGGEVRVVRPRESVRLTWRPAAGWPRPSTIQARVVASPP